MRATGAMEGTGCTQRDGPGADSGLRRFVAGIVAFLVVAGLGS
jgi:hypothetical protein